MLETIVRKSLKHFTTSCSTLVLLDESINLRESLKRLDSQHFDLYSESYELEMLYESARDTLSAQQKNDLSKFVRKARTAEEVNTYMTE